MTVRLTPARRKWLEKLRDAGPKGCVPYGHEWQTHYAARGAGLAKYGPPDASGQRTYLITEKGLSALEQDAAK